MGKGGGCVRCGISTACFFPEDILDAIRQVIETGAPVTEIFLNTFSELEEDFVGRLEGLVRDAGIRVAAVHPFSSMMEGFFFASHYKGRLADGLALYRKYFEIAARLGADKLVFHGDHRINREMFSARLYAQNFKALAALGREYGVTLCHENVYYCRLAEVEDVRLLAPLLGPDAAFVLDTKQVQRAGESVKEMVATMGKAIRHVHISDFAEGDDCLPPGQGGFGFSGLIGSLLRLGYEGDLIIEVYRDNFTRSDDLRAAMEYVNALLVQADALK